MKTTTLSKYSKMSIEKQKNFTGILKWDNGTIEYLKNGIYHREDGPAFIRSDGEKEYWIHGEYIKNCKSDETFFLLIDLYKLKKIL
jgi:hypothetical protein